MKLLAVILVVSLMVAALCTGWYAGRIYEDQRILQKIDQLQQ